jgi:pimeloyl-ACP methyl ester carboxylesterase
VLEAGPANGRPVVLLHGWAVSAYLWRHNIKPLAAAGYRVHAPDLPGHGLSAAPRARGRFTLGRFADNLAMLLDALEMDRAPIVAQSMGARIALELARRESARVTRLALFGPVGFGALPPHRALVPFVPSLPGALPSMLVTRRVVEVIQRRVHGKVMNGWFTERDVDEYWAPSQFPDLVRAQLQILREFDWAPLEPAVLAALPMPTLVVFGTLDRTVRPANAERLVSALPAGRLEWIVGGGHVVMEEVPERVNEMLLAFLGA